jgi:hypothetical protein
LGRDYTSDMNKGTHRFKQTGVLEMTGESVGGMIPALTGWPGDSDGRNEPTTNCEVD